MCPDSVREAPRVSELVEALRAADRHITELWSQAGDAFQFTLDEGCAHAASGDPCPDGDPDCESCCLQASLTTGMSDLLARLDAASVPASADVEACDAVVNRYTFDAYKSTLSDALAAVLGLGGQER